MDRWNRRCGRDCIYSVETVKFKQGDCVVLKSGSPKMVVVGQASDGGMMCVYYHKHGDIIKITISSEALKLVNVRKRKK